MAAAALCLVVRCSAEAPASFARATAGLHSPHGMVTTGEIQAHARKQMSLSKHGTGACAIDDNERLFCWAGDVRDQLYKGPLPPNAPPSYSDYIPMPDDEGVAAVSVSEQHACSLLRSGGVVCWGYGRDGRLGYGSIFRVGNTLATTPDKMGRVPLPAGVHAIGISTGDDFSCALLNISQVLCWGNAAEGRLGYAAPAGMQDTSGSVVSALPFVTLPNNATAVALSGGPSLTCAILDSSGVYCWGQYAEHAIASQDTLTHVTYMPGNDTVVYLSVGRTHVCAITATQALLCWGLPGSNVLGTTQRMVGPHPPAPVLLPVGAQAVAVTAGAGHTCAILQTRKVLCWGSNNWGLLGQNTTSAAGGQLPSAGPHVYLGGVAADAIEAGHGSSCARLVNGSTICWGSGGQFGNGITHTVGDGLQTRPLFWKRFVAPPAGSGGFKKLSLGGSHACAIFMDDTLRCWGLSTAWMLGYIPSQNVEDSPDTPPAQLPPIQLPAGSTPTHIAAGNAFTCVVLNNTWLTCWGRNSDGQLGQWNKDDYGDSPATAPVANITVPLPDAGPIKKLVVGNNVVCVLFEIGKVSCWGNGQYGAHGRGTTDDRFASRYMPFLVFYVDFSITDLASTPAANHVCGILGLSGPRAVCWGRGADGALGNGETTNVGDGVGRGTSWSFTARTGRDVVQLALGRFHSCGLLRNKEVVCWGDSGDGALGIGSTRDVIGDENMVWANLPGSQQATAVYAGGRQTCAVLESGDLHCWGKNAVGELGYNHTLKISDAEVTLPVSLPSAAAIKDVQMDDGATCVHFVNHTLVCWGASARVGWGIDKHTSPVQLPLSGSVPPAPTTSPFGPFNRTGIIIIAQDEENDDDDANDMTDAGTGGATNVTTIDSSSDDASTGGATNGTAANSTSDTPSGPADDTPGGTAAGGGSAGGQAGGGSSGGGSTGGQAGGQTGENDGATSGGGAGGATGTTTVSGEGTASVAGGLLAGIIIAAVLVLALTGLAVYKLVLVPAAAATKAAAGKGGAPGAVATMTNPLSRATAGQA